MHRVFACMVVALVGCTQSSALQCDFGVCPAFAICDEVHDRCVTDEEITPCVGVEDGGDCLLRGADGFCDGGVCMPKTCGDGRVEGAEECDGETFLDEVNDCLDLGYYGSGPITCNADCTIDESQCQSLGYCGDGAVNGVEACDYRAANPDATCTSLGFYSDTVAPCTVSCSYATVGVCKGRCGDGMLDPQHEVCEPTVELPSYLSCLDYGFDSGALACGGTCTPAFTGCQHIGAWPVASVNTSPLSVWQIGAADAFVVGYDPSTERGFLSRWDGATLVPIEDYPARLLAVSASSSTNAIAVGMNGRIVHFDGTSAVEKSSGTTATLTGVFVRSTTDAYAVANDGTVLHFDGTAWSAVSTGNALPLTDVWMTGAGDVWASGASGLLLHGAGTSWTAVPTGASEAVMDVWGTSSSNVYAVTQFGKLLHWNGTAVSPLQLSSTILHAIWGADANDIFVTGNAGLFHFDGERWVTIDSSRLSNTSIIDVHGVDDRHVSILDLGGFVLRWEGFGWATPVVTTADAKAIWASSRADQYVVTNTAVRRFNGSAWTTPLSGAGFRTVWGSAANDVFVGGSSEMWHWNGSSWTSQTLPAEANGGEIGGLSGTSSSDVWAIVDGGAVLHYNGTAWSTTTTLNAAYVVWAFDATHVFAAGNGELYRYNGSTWTTQLMPNESYYALWGTSASNVFAVGAAGAVAHFDGSTWTPITVETNRSLIAIHGTGPSDIWIGGSDALLRFDGTAWTPVTANSSSLSALYASERAITIVNSSGTVRDLLRCDHCR